MYILANSRAKSLKSTPVKWKQNMHSTTSKKKSKKIIIINSDSEENCNNDDDKENTSTKSLALKLKELEYWEKSLALKNGNLI